MFWCHQVQFCYLRPGFLLQRASEGVLRVPRHVSGRLCMLAWLQRGTECLDAECKHGRSSLASRPEVPQGTADDC
jgi:hypothetical protein